MRSFILFFALQVAAVNVTISNGTVVGSATSTVETFNGIPFAQQPVGLLRLTKPQVLTTGFGVLNATSVPKKCVQYVEPKNVTALDQSIQDVVNWLFPPTPPNEGEDCLTLNVQRPAGTTAGANLPVLVYIFGGGFREGSTQSFDATKIIERSTGSHVLTPIIHVAMNHRLGAFGFLPGSQVKAEGVSNLGLLDQRLALKWVQDNIAAFGGDPTKVTLMGESSGSISTFLHTVANGGDNTYKGKALFRAAIMDSGTVAPTLPIDSTKANNVYNQFLAQTPCNGLTPSTQLVCLRLMPTNDFAAASDAITANGSGFNMAFIPRPDSSSGFYTVSGEVSLSTGAYARIPIITGNQEDEGTFVTFFMKISSWLTTHNKLVDYIYAWYPNANRGQVEAHINTYSNATADGSPFRTNSSNELYTGYKRASAVIGDIGLALQRRIYLSKVASTITCWSYIQTNLNWATFVGTLHGADVVAMYSELTGTAFAATMQVYYISFVAYLNPNAIRIANIGNVNTLVNWPQYTLTGTGAMQILNMDALTQSAMPDTFRTDQYNSLVSNHVAFSL